VGGRLGELGVSGLASQRELQMRLRLVQRADLQRQAKLPCAEAPRKPERARDAGNLNGRLTLSRMSSTKLPIGTAFSGWKA